MKRFMKGCGITALVMIVIGLILAGLVSVIKGPRYMNSVMNELTGGRSGEWLDSNGIELHNGYISGLNDFEGYDIEEASIYERGYDSHGGNIHYKFEGGNVTGLDLNIGGCMFYLTESEDDTFYVEGENTGKIQTYQENGIIYVKATRSGKNRMDFENCTITLYVPAGYHFGSAFLEMGAGSMEIDLASLQADNVSVKAGAGLIHIYNLTADQLTVSAGAGEVVIDNVVCNSLDATAEAGHVYIDGLVNGNILGNCAAGSLELSLQNEFDDFNYEVQSSVGYIELDGQSFSGLDRMRSIGNGADKEMKLTSSVGSITVEYY